MELNWILEVPDLVGSNLPILLKGMWITLQITFCAIIVGIVWGTALAMMRLSNKKYLNIFAKLYVNIFRSVPLLLVLLWFYLAFPAVIKVIFHLPPSSDIRLISAMVAFSLFEASYYSEIIRAGINGISKGQYHAALALGMSKMQMMNLIILPQAFRTMIPLLLTQGIVLFQDTSLVYVMSLMDFFGSSLYIGRSHGSSAEIAMVFFTGGVYFVICFIASTLVRHFKKRVN